MAGDKKGPVDAGAPQKCSHEDFLAMLREIKEMKPPPGCFWIREQDRILIRSVITWAMRGQPLDDTWVFLEIDPERPSRGRSSFHLAVGRMRYDCDIYGWAPTADVTQILRKLEPACDPAEEISDRIGQELGFSGQARRRAGAGALSRAALTVRRSIQNAFEAARIPTSWTNEIPEDAQIEGLGYRVLPDDDGDA